MTPGSDATYESEDVGQVRSWLRNLGFKLTRTDGWVHDDGFIASITFSGVEQKWCGSHTQSDIAKPRAPAVVPRLPA